MSVVRTHEIFKSNSSNSGLTEQMRVMAVVVFTVLAVGCSKAPPWVALEHACNSKDIHACARLAAMYRKGEGVAKDEVKAVALFRKACDGGETRGCFDLGNMYANGLGVAPDHTKAVALFQKVCDGGNADGCLN